MDRFDKYAPYAVTVACAMYLAALVGACGGAFADAHKPGCEPQDLAALEAEYVTEATAACKAEGAHSTATCKAFPSIRDKYRAKRAAYVKCKP